MTAPDRAIRNLARGVAQATVEYVSECLREHGHIATALRVAAPEDVADMLMLARQEIAELMATATIESAKEVDDSEVHALRRLMGAIRVGELEPDGHGKYGDPDFVNDVDSSNCGDLHSHGCAVGRWEAAKIARRALATPEAEGGST
jgi:hypothetical protein